MLNGIRFTTRFLTFALTCSNIFALDTELHFWPTAITVFDADAKGALFMWPEYRVLLQTKEGAKTYEPAIIDDNVAEKLSHLFTPERNSPIVLERDALSSTLGLLIPGGKHLRERNRELLPMMVDKFSSCLSTLSDAELSQMKEVLYSPTLLLNQEGVVHLGDEKRRIASVMFTNFQANRCDSATTPVPELLRQKSEQYLLALLTGNSDGIVEPSGALMVITMLFRDLLFSAKGLWVRITLAKLQDFIGQRLATLPALKDAAFLDRDYDNFLDFILLTRDTSGLTMEHYLGIARAFAIDKITDVFKPFWLKSYLAEGQIHVINLNLGSRSSTIFLGVKP